MFCFCWLDCCLGWRMEAARRWCRWCGGGKWEVERPCSFFGAEPGLAAGCAREPASRMAALALAATHYSSQLEWGARELRSGKLWLLIFMSHSTRQLPGVYSPLFLYIIGRRRNHLRKKKEAEKKRKKEREKESCEDVTRHVARGREGGPLMLRQLHPPQATTPYFLPFSSVNIALLRFPRVAPMPPSPIKTPGRSSLSSSRIVDHGK